MAIFSAVSTDSEPELVKNTWSSGRGASSLSRAASSNGSGEPIWKCGAKSMVAAWRAIASTIRGRAWPALQHHRPAVPSRIWRPSTTCSRCWARCRRRSDAGKASAKENSMLVGVPSETKVHEYRVGITPAGARELSAHGHQVLVQRGAGLGAGLADEAYEAAGAQL